MTESVVARQTEGSASYSGTLVGSQGEIGFCMKSPTLFLIVVSN